VHYAVDEGLVAVTEPITVVRMLNPTHMRASSPTSPCTVVSRRMRASTGGRSTRDRSNIVLEFLNPAGSVFGRLLPTGHLQDQIETTRGAFVISIVDVRCCRCWLRSGGGCAQCCSR
jgi:2-methylaconitate cis-trans-isomerase PrpF